MTTSAPKGKTTRLTRRAGGSLLQSSNMGSDDDDDDDEEKRRDTQFPATDEEKGKLIQIKKETTGVLWERKRKGEEEGLPCMRGACMGARARQQSFSFLSFLSLFLSRCCFIPLLFLFYSCFILVFVQDAAWHEHNFVFFFFFLSLCLLVKQGVKDGCIIKFLCLFCFVVWTIYLWLTQRV